MYRTIKSNPSGNHYAIAILRIGIGIMFFLHGMPKLLGGLDIWISLGSVAGFHNFYPAVWGLIASIVETIGGLFIVFKIKMTLTCLLNIIVMIFALWMHVQAGDIYSVYSHPLKSLLIFIALLLYYYPSKHRI